MPYPMTVDAGGISPLIICDEVITINGGSAQTYGANIVYLYAFELYATTTFSGGKWRVAATATGVTDIGIYTFAGVLQANLGGMSNTASANMSANFSAGNVTLVPGQYFAAMCVSNNTDTINGSAPSNAVIMTRMRQATNTGTAGVLPATTGGYSDVPAKFPAFSLTVVNGLT